MLTSEDLFGWDLHTKVATCDHHAICSLEDLIKFVQTLLYALAMPPPLVYTYMAWSDAWPVRKGELARIRHTTGHAYLGMRHPITISTQSPVALTRPADVEVAATRARVPDSRSWR